MCCTSYLFKVSQLRLQNGFGSQRTNFPPLSLSYNLVEGRSMAMKMKLALMALLVLIAMNSESEACRRVCYIRIRVYYVYSCGCYVRVYQRYCRWFCWGKRSIPNTIDGFPCKFGEYDADKNGGISEDEFATALKMKREGTGLDSSFKTADKNKDGKIDCEEFKKAPFEFQCKPSC